MIKTHSTLNKSPKIVMNMEAEINRISNLIIKQEGTCERLETRTDYHLMRRQGTVDFGYNLSFQAEYNLNGKTVLLKGSSLNYPEYFGENATRPKLNHAGIVSTTTYKNDKFTR